MSSDTNAPAPPTSDPEASVAAAGSSGDASATPALTLTDARAHTSLTAFFANVPVTDNISCFCPVAEMKDGLFPWALVYFGAGISPVVVGGARADQAALAAHECAILFPGSTTPKVIDEVGGHVTATLAPRAGAIDLHVLQYRPDVLNLVSRAYTDPLSVSAVQLEATVRLAVLVQEAEEQHICALDNPSSYSIATPDFESDDLIESITKTDEAIGSGRGVFNAAYGSILTYNTTVHHLASKRAKVRVSVCRGACQGGKCAPLTNEHVEHALAREESHKAIDALSLDARRILGVSDAMLEAYRELHKLRSMWRDIPAEIAQALDALPEDQRGGTAEVAVKFMQGAAAKLRLLETEYVAQRHKTLQRAVREICHTHMRDEFRSSEEFGERLTTGVASVREMQDKALSLVQRARDRSFLAAEYQTEKRRLVAELDAVAHSTDSDFQQTLIAPVDSQMGGLRGRAAVADSKFRADLEQAQLEFISKVRAAAERKHETLSQLFSEAMNIRNDFNRKSQEYEEMHRRSFLEKRTRSSVQLVQYIEGEVDKTRKQIYDAIARARDAAASIRAAATEARSARLMHGAFYVSRRFLELALRSAPADERERIYNELQSDMTRAVEERRALVRSQIDKAEAAAREIDLSASRTESDAASLRFGEKISTFDSIVLPDSAMRADESKIHAKMADSFRRLETELQSSRAEAQAVDAAAMIRSSSGAVASSTHASVIE